ncbi:hypothetical protein ACFQGX_48340 [Nonomuraea dietziae]
MTELAAALSVTIQDPAPPREIHFSRAGCRLRIRLGWNRIPGAVAQRRVDRAHVDFVCLGLRGAARLTAQDPRGHDASR